MAASIGIALAVRLRPPRDEASAVTVDQDGYTRCSSKTFRPDQVVQGSDQAVAYEAIAAPLLDQLKRGYSCSLLAYGQTGSGKTHTVFGPPGCLTEEAVRQAGGGVPSSWGLMPRIACKLFAAGLGAVHASAVEVYQDKAYDLLDDRAPLTVGVKSGDRQVGGGGAIVIGDLSDKGHHGAHPAGCRCGKCFAAKKEELADQITKRDRVQAAARGGDPRPRSSSKQQDSFSTVGESTMELSSVEQVARFALAVEVTRTAASHALNARSSRSHCLVRLHATLAEGGRLSGRTLLFVDLAGSERILKTGVEGAARAQAVAINSSLSALGKVIKALGERAAHVPYRDSTLTMLLRSSLGGRAVCSFVVNVAPDAAHAEESLCSLAFGERLGAVRTTATVVVQDAHEVAEDVRTRLRDARAALVRLEATGHGGHFGGQAHEVRLFKENIARFRWEERLSRQMSGQTAELTSAGTDPEKVAEAGMRARAHAAEAANYRDIVLRQNSIAGLFTPPKPAYLAKAALVKQLEAKLTQLGLADEAGDNDGVGHGDGDASDTELARILAGALTAYRG